LQIKAIPNDFDSLFRSPSSLCTVDRNRERGGGGSGAAAAWLAAEQTFVR